MFYYCQYLIIQYSRLHFRHPAHVFYSNHVLSTSIYIHFYTLTPYLQVYPTIFLVLISGPVTSSSLVPLHNFIFQYILYHCKRNHHNAHVSIRRLVVRPL